MPFLRIGRTWRAVKGKRTFILSSSHGEEEMRIWPDNTAEKPRVAAGSGSHKQLISSHCVIKQALLLLLLLLRETFTRRESFPCVEDHRHLLLVVKKNGERWLAGRLIREYWVLVCRCWTFIQPVLWSTWCQDASATNRVSGLVHLWHCPLRSCTAEAWSRAGTQERGRSLLANQACQKGYRPSTLVPM